MTSTATFDKHIVSEVLLEFVHSQQLTGACSASDGNDEVNSKHQHMQRLAMSLPCCRGSSTASKCDAPAVHQMETMR
jgi:hypothetical protein